MLNFIVRRIAQGMLLIWLVSMLSYVILHLVPGGPLSQFVQASSMTQEELNRIAEQMGLHRPVIVQYLDWARGMLLGDWGKSYRDNTPVLLVIESRLSATLSLMITSTIFAVLTGTTMGVISAVRRYSIFDQMVTIGAMVTLSIPTFWFGLMVIYIFSVKLGWIPPGGTSPVGETSIWVFLHHLLGPALVLGLVTIAIWSRFVRSSVLDVLGQDYIRTAVAKGLAGRLILLRHVLRNALLPMITLAGMELPSLLSGALVTETVFSWPGMGRLFLDSIEYRDYPVIMGVLVLVAVLVILGSMLADILYVVADPRIQMN